MKAQLTIIPIAALLLISCGKQDGDNYQVIDKELDGKISILNQGTGRITIINKSNRIDDVIDLNLKNDAIEKIKTAKENQDAVLKIKAWGQMGLTGTKYKVELSTRHYKDRLLYTFTFSPLDAGSIEKAKLTSFNLRDANGFILEKVNPSLAWTTIVGDDGKPLYAQASGEVPMTLDNYLEIASYDPTWYFR